MMLKKAKGFLTVWLKEKGKYFSFFPKDHEWVYYCAVFNATGSGAFINQVLLYNSLIIVWH